MESLPIVLTVLLTLMVYLLLQHKQREAYLLTSLVVLSCLAISLSLHWPVKIIPLIPILAPFLVYLSQIASGRSTFPEEWLLYVILTVFIGFVLSFVFFAFSFFSNVQESLQAGFLVATVLTVLYWTIRFTGDFYSEVFEHYRYKKPVNLH